MEEGRSTRMLAGGTSLLPTAAIGSCDAINTAKWHFTGTEQAETRGESGAQAASASWEAPHLSLHLDVLLLIRRTGLLFLRPNPGGNQ